MREITLLHDVVREAAKNFPSKVGLTAADGHFTFLEIDTLANKFMFALRSKGIKKGDRVAVYLDKTALSVIIFQGILRAGAIYVPIDLQIPIHGVAEILRQCSPTAIFTSERLASQINEKYNQSILYLTELSTDSIQRDDANSSETDLKPIKISENDPAYILFTSGTTGAAKGACLSHKNGLSFAKWAAKLTKASEKDVIANHSPFSFGISVYDLYVSFLVGARLTIVPSRLSLTGQGMSDFIFSEKITHWYSVPSAILLMMRAGAFIEKAKPSLNVLIFAGELFPIEQLNNLRENLPEVRFFNFYGATETNVSCYYEIKNTISGNLPAAPIGLPACNNKVWVAPKDEDEKNGELMVSGPTVMLGYWGQELKNDLTYSSNDLVRIDEQGILHFIGRNDSIVKVKGYRVSLNEIEHTLRNHPSICDIAVIQVGESYNSKLIAYATLIKDSLPPSLIELKELCAAQLPPYKIIHKINYLEALPFNSNGKINRPALVELENRNKS